MKLRNYFILSLMLVVLPMGASYAAGSIFDLDTTEKKFYWGLHLGAVKEVDVTLGMAVVGWDMNNLLSFEVHAGKSNTQEEDFGGIKRTFELEYLASAFVKLNLRKEDYNFFALGGVSTTSMKGSLASVTLLDDTYSEPAYGAGVELYGSRNTALTLSWIRYLTDIDGSGVDVTSTNLGFIHHFDWPSLSSRY